MRGYVIVPTARGHVARFEFDADDCEGIGYALGAHDAGMAEMLEAADKIREADDPEGLCPR